MAAAESTRPRIANAAVAAAFAAYPPKLRKQLLAVRRMILEVARKTAGVGKLQETLKWGEPAYVTAETGSGSTIRINRHKQQDRQYAVYFHCQTTLVDSFRGLFPNTFKFEGDRCIVFDDTDRVPAAELKVCIGMALTYHQAKASRPGRRD